MSSIALERNLANAYICELKALIHDWSIPLDCLVIAHDDAVLTRRLSKALHEPTAILRIAQGRWDMSGDGLQEAVDWAIQEGQCKNVMLVGHSMSSPLRSWSAVVGGEEPANAHHASSQHGYARLLGGVHGNQRQRQDAMKHFAEQFKQLSEIPEVRNRVSIGALQLHGLFYLAESGAFLAFDPASGAFAALTDATRSA